MRALVTGAGKRLGRAMALKLATEGYDVAVHYNSSAAEAEEVAGQIRAMGRQAVTLEADLLSQAASADLLPRAASALGGAVTCLVNNASIFEPDLLETATTSSWNRHFDSNLRAPFVLIQAMARQGVAPRYDSQGETLAWGLVVNMVDQRVRNLAPDYMSYTLAKSALWTLTQTASQALAPGIRVNAIGPGPTLANIHQSPAEFAQERAATPLQRGVHPEDITAALGYLLAAPAVTGQLICVDGGEHLG
ncbi:SDR family oxidoreductase [Pseudophaeobacter sp.]|jgi:NAD(P)-dependent dehydrogenase (short-subunit alcohol dehydrogenase family)|uniref:SDR family oxidoreductase n=1 Tax=Pseudophaeobacter sp. TaxID=1971739 RepID=UPI003A97CE3E